MNKKKKDVNKKHRRKTQRSKQRKKDAIAKAAADKISTTGKKTE